MSKFKIAEVELSDIKLVKKNAHFMEQSTFNALVRNIRRDGQLSSVPFCVKHADGKYTVVSGNHRTQAAKMAGLTSIYVMYIDEAETTNDWLLATQLSHNSIVGQDDAELLKQLLDEITDVAMKEYAHISNEILDSVKDIDYTVEMPNNEIIPITLMFVDTFKVKFDRLMERLESYTDREIENMTLMDIDTLDRLNEVSQKVSKKYQIKAQALAVCKMLEIVNNILDGNGEGEDE